jgi:hypothetical protein
MVCFRKPIPRPRDSRTPYIGPDLAGGSARDSERAPRLSGIDLCHCLLVIAEETTMKRQVSGSETCPDDSVNDVRTLRAKRVRAGAGTECKAP